MLTIEKHQKTSALAAYFADDIRTHLTTQSESSNLPKPVWFGKGAERLDLAGKLVTVKEFNRVANNQHPRSGRRLTVRRKANSRAAFDLVFSAPKSVSILALIAKDEQVLSAHYEAVTEASTYLERFVESRVRKSGHNRDRRTGNLIGARFEHVVSRASDPQLHTHLLIFNATFDAQETRWKAIQLRSLYANSGLITEIYRSALVRELNVLGYQTEPKRSAFEIAGVSSNLIELFSKRHAEIDAAEIKIGGTSDPKRRALIARTTRKKKLTKIPLHLLQEKWTSQLSAEEADKLRQIKLPAPPPWRHLEHDLAAAVDWTKRHIFERVSTCSLSSFITAVLAQHRGSFTPEEVENYTSSYPGMTICDGACTTSEAIDQELELLGIVNSGRRKMTPVNECPVGKHRAPEVPVCSLLNGTDQFALLVGPPGAGKTSVLKALMETAQEYLGMSSIVAPTAAAVDVLRNDGFKGAKTLSSFLRDYTGGKRTFLKALILDEAGLVSIADMLALAQLAQTHDFRVFLSGDPDQNHSVQAGDALRIILEHTQTHRFYLEKIYRQTHLEYRTATNALKEGKFTKGLQILSQLGWIHELGSNAAYAELVKTYVSMVTQRESVLAVTSTWALADDITNNLRDSMRRSGLLSAEESPFSALSPLHLTSAQRELAHWIPTGSVLRFVQRTARFESSEMVDVISHVGEQLRLRRSTGEEMTLHPKPMAGAFQVYTPRSIQVSSGDKLLLQANHRDRNVKLTNGELVQVHRVAWGAIHLCDGRVLPRSYRYFRHGYCVTSQCSQGKTVDHAIVALPSSFAPVSRQMLYVGLTRGRLSCRLFTDDLDLLLDTSLRSCERQSAIELLSFADRVGH